MSLEYRVGDVMDRLAEIPDGSIDLIVTSPPFLALRSYLPADHPDKGKEIGSEATPAAFIDTLLQLTAEFGRVLAPHGSLCVELGDTYSGTNPKAALDACEWTTDALGVGRGNKSTGGAGWPLAKSLTGIPHAYMLSLAYGWNVLTGQPSPAGQYRIRNQIVWARPNPPVGALGDKFRPATSYITVACRGTKRFFDLDAVRTPHGPPGGSATPGVRKDTGSRNDDGSEHISNGHEAGAPPLDWHSDLPDGDWLWKLPTQPYKGAHYATFPLELPTRLIMAMCPLRVCTTCGRPSERITGDPEYVRTDTDIVPARLALTNGERVATGVNQHTMPNGANTSVTRNAPTLGWSDCGHNTWRTGVTLDPFAGSGTTLQAAQNVGRHAIGIDLDETNADLARARVGMFMTVTP